MHEPLLEMDGRAETSWMFQTFTSISPPAETIYFSKGENAMSQTFLRWPDRVVSSCKSFADHNLIDLSWLAVAMILSLGENLATLMYF